MQLPDITELSSLLRTVSPSLQSNGEALALSDCCIYWAWGVIEQAAAGKNVATPWPGGLRTALSRWRATNDRRYLWRSHREPRGDAAWLCVVRARPDSWHSQFQPVLHEVVAQCPELGILVGEEVRRNRKPLLEHCGSALSLPVSRRWRCVPPAADGLDGGATTLRGRLADWLGEDRSRLVADRLARGLTVHARVLSRWLDTLDATLQDRPVAALLVNNDLALVRRTAVMLAHRRGVPTINIQHGMINDQPQYRLGISDHYLLWGSFFADLLGRLGSDRERLHVVGAPQYDSAAGSPSKPPVPSRRLLYAAQPAGWEIPEETCLRLIDCHTELARRSRETEVSIRLHPRDSEQMRARVSGLVGTLPNLHLDTSPTISEALASCSAVSTVFSTVSIDAVVAGKPVLVLDLAGKVEHMPLARRPPLFAVERAQDLDRVLEQAHTWRSGPDAGEDLRRFRDDYLAGLDGRAAVRAADEVLAVLEDQCRA